MIAVIETGGKQYLVKAGQILKVEKLEGKKGDNISLSNVLAVSDSSNFTFGKPLIKNASVEAKILHQIKDKKIIVFKKRRRKNSRSTKGHRQHLTVLQIESINHNGNQSISIKKETKTKKTEKITKTSKKEQPKNDKEKIVKKSVSKKKIIKKTSSKKIVKKKTIKKQKEL